jgi:hypothetical protein
VRLRAVLGCACAQGVLSGNGLRITARSVLHERALVDLGRTRSVQWRRAHVAPQYVVVQQEQRKAAANTDNQEVNMNTGYGFGKRDERDSAQRAEMIRFLASAIALWGVCAVGIYLIGLAGPAAAPDGMVASATAPAQPNPSFTAHPQ